MKRRIAIVGYGSAGQCAAVLLERDGHCVEVFERVPEPGPVGAGFLLQPSGLQVLWQMGLLAPVLSHGAPVERLYGDTPCGRTVMEMGYAGLDPRLVGVGLQRGALFSILAGAFEGASDSQLVDEIETNLLGVLRVTQAFLPAMRERRQGVILTTTSIGGLVTFPFNSVYHATKWGLEGWSESLAYELAPLP